jgi:hypothetical protein
MKPTENNHCVIVPLGDVTSETCEVFKNMKF